MDFVGVAMEPQVVDVADRAGFQAALASGWFDVIYGDFTLPGYSGLQAVRQQALYNLGRNLSSVRAPQEAAVIRDVADQLFAWDVFSLDLLGDDPNQTRPILNPDASAGRRVVVETPVGTIQLLQTYRRRSDGEELFTDAGFNPPHPRIGAEKKSRTRTRMMRKLGGRVSQSRIENSQGSNRDPSSRTSRGFRKSY